VTDICDIVWETGASSIPAGGQYDVAAVGRRKRRGLIVLNCLRCRRLPVRCARLTD